MNPDSVSVMMTTAHVSGGAPASGSGIYCRAAYSNFTRCDSVGSNFLGHTIIFSGPSRHFDSSQIRGRYFNADCAIHAKVAQVPFINRIMLVHILRDSPNNVFKGYDVLPWPLEHVWNALGRQLQPSRDTGELTAQMQRLWQDLPQGVISDLIESMPRRISACIAARTITDF
ncbi:uncharacterized protein TNCV_2112481 [Trichonephila clavipes]|nr:uncharacterized protein TNCV_2112481 [Trichonephila clavipes]